MFIENQKIVWVGVRNGEIIPENPMVLEGKVYTVKDPKSAIAWGHVYIQVEGFPEGQMFVQDGFVPVEFDRYTESEIFEALKGQPITNK